jgi:lipid II isoglutaminyl synthase (glutamine-hydrolysing)
VPTESSVRIVLLQPQLLGTYGDGGNALVLADRARRRGHDVEVIAVDGSTPVPQDGDVYLLGGGEDKAQILATELLRKAGIDKVVEAARSVLAVCAGLQILGTEFTDPTGVAAPGLGLLDVTSSRGAVRAVGEVVAQPYDGSPVLTGYENHRGVTVVGPAATPLARVQNGTGNGDPEHTEGAVQGSIIGTYLHGPVLARNPSLADRLLSAALGPLSPLDDELLDQLRAERLRAGRSVRRGGPLRRLRLSRAAR